MTTPVLDADRLDKLEELDTPSNATWTSDFPIPENAWEAYLSALDRIDDTAIALEVRARPMLIGNVVELEEFVRLQGYDPAELGD